MHTAIAMKKPEGNLSETVVSNKSHIDPNTVCYKKKWEWRWEKCITLGQSGYGIINHKYNEYCTEEVGISDMNTTLKFLW